MSDIAINASLPSTSDIRFLVHQEGSKRRPAAAVIFRLSQNKHNHVPNKHSINRYRLYSEVQVGFFANQRRERGLRDMAFPLVRCASACCVFLGVMTIGAVASEETPCEWWDSVPGLFFEQATLTDVSRCLKGGKDVNARGASSVGEVGDTLLHAAAAATDDPKIIEVLLEAGADVNARGSFGNTPLHDAAGDNDNPAVIRVLLDAGADVHALGLNEETPLHAAARSSDNPVILEALIEAGAELDARDPTGGTPLMEWALHGDNDAILTTLVTAGADPNAFDNLGDTALRTAVWMYKAYQEEDDHEHTKRYASKITALIAAGADPNLSYTKVYDDGSVFHRTSARELAEEEGLFPELVGAFSEPAVAAYRAAWDKARAEADARRVREQVRSAQASCDRWNTRGFFSAASPADIASCLETEDASAKDDQGRTPMHLAALHGTAVAVAALAEAGADPNVPDGKGRTPLHLIAVFGANPETVAALVQAGADLAALDAKGRTPLEFAEKFSETPAIVVALREAAATATAPPEPGPSETDIASVSCENWNTARFFRNATVEDLARCLATEDPNARNASGRTPMHYAAQGASPAFVIALTEAGAELNEPDDKGGWTPLHLAAWFSTTPSVVAALLAAGADPAVRDGAGKTPWDYARENAALEGTPPYWRLQEEGSE